MLQSPDLQLIRDCLKKNSSDCWRTIASTFRTLIAATVLKVGHRFGEQGHSHVEDLVQDTFLKLCAHDFRIFKNCRSSEPGMVFGLVQAVATTTVLDYHRTRAAQKRGGTVQFISLDDDAGMFLGSSDDKQLERQMLIAKVDSLLLARGSDAAHQKERQLFWLYYRHGLTAAEIAGLPAFQLTAKGVESALHRIAKELRHALGENSSVDAKGFQP